MRNQRLLIGIVVLALSPTGAILADTPLPQPPAAALGLIHDLRLTLTARKLLASDPALSSLRLGVEVRAGIATLWGDVPSAGVGRLAVAKLESIEGIREVRSEVIGSARPVPRSVVDLSVPSWAPRRIEIEAAKPNSESGQVERKTRERVVPVSEGKSATKPGAMPEPGPLLLPTPKFRNVNVLPPSTPARVNREVRPGTPLQTAVTKMKASDKRFGAISVQVRGNRVYVEPGDADENAVNALREALRRIPGVSEVVVSN